MKLKISLLTLLIGGIAFVFANFYPETNKQTNKPNLVALQVDPEQLNVGDVFVGSRHTFQFTITNKEKFPLEVKGMDRACGFGTIEPEKFTLQPNEHITLKASFDAVYLSCAKVKDPTQINFQIGPRLDPEYKDRTPVWNVTGRIVQAIEAKPSAISLEPRSFDEPIVFNPIVINENQPISSFSCEVTDSDFEAEIKPLGENTKPLAIFLKVVNKQKKKYIFDLKITPTLANGIKTPPIIVPVSLTIVDDIQTEELNRNLGSGKINEWVKGEFVLHSLSRKPFEIVDAAKDTEDTKITFDKDNPKKISISQRITKQGHQTGKLKLVVQYEPNQRKEVEIEYSWYGIDGK